MSATLLDHAPIAQRNRNGRPGPTTSYTFGSNTMSNHFRQMRPGCNLLLSQPMGLTMSRECRSLDMDKVKSACPYPRPTATAAALLVFIAERGRLMLLIQMFMRIKAERSPREGQICSYPRPFIKEQSVYTIAIDNRSFIYSDIYV